MQTHARSCAGSPTSWPAGRSRCSRSGRSRTSPEQWEGARKQFYAALARFPGVEPVSVGLFGGAIVPETLHFPFSRIPAGDLRDWDAIEEWSARLPDALGVGALVG